MAELELEDLLEQLPGSPLLEAQAFFLDDVQADDAQIADIIADESRDVVIADQQKVDRHVLAVADKLVLALGDFQTATLQQIERVIGEAPGFLHRNLDALLGLSMLVSLVRASVRPLFGNRRARP